MSERVRERDSERERECSGSQLLSDIQTFFNNNSLFAIQSVLGSVSTKMEGNFQVWVNLGVAKTIPKICITTS